MGLFNSVKLEYTGEVGSIVRIPCRSDSSNLVFTGAGKSIKIYESLLGKRYKKGKKSIMSYFGFTSASDVSEYSYRSGYTATHTGSGRYNVKENREHKGEAIAMEVIVGASPDVVANKKSNVNKWLNAVAKPPRGLMWWLVGIISLPVLIGFAMLGSGFYRIYLSFVKKSCVRKAKKSYKKNNNTVVVF